ncbi:hypothetical protein [Burkholderia pseudomallei]|uniref:hypothetical protein n=2 Tax=Burkholderia pseudomallei TaxID=28450 RepID=UPI000431C6C2|nr:hypothetical protein [Burkholderia pseudomallei]AIV60537.1 hypothetical protein Y044_1658 [Burkholderia pseudomallei MSHR2243]AIV73030.1 hypothetical protein Y028_968 [Burkholderia pseudomallei MSHR62]EXI99523.1 hypothetical protein T210_0127285 [Burkholderia pseudomallei MSHR6137]KGC98072.1 hypothetical protein DO71_6246 [Burkholderia pseudomallei]KGS34398.1 hypothetical protein X945_6112 [Burkholderia pseudomallei ABCPW 107]
MSSIGEKAAAFEVLLAARRIADHAKDEGALFDEKFPRTTCDHLGAVLADSVLQAGLNYTTVVRPRVQAILRAHPTRNTISSLVSLIRDGKTSAFLNWRHHEKVRRFEALVAFMVDWGIEDVKDLRGRLASDEFRDAIQAVHGIGPKTVDYMACLIGIDSIAVDRHVRTFAKTVGVENADYHFLRKSFCCAADLLSLPRREFDAWLWRRAVAPAQVQLTLGV